MISLPKNLIAKIENRKLNNALRQLQNTGCISDFSSNDYIGFAKNTTIFDQTHQLLLERKLQTNGATGSRLISGNHQLYEETENYIAKFHQAEAALIFNSGYDANIGFFGCVPQRQDIILFDELCHASIRDGILMSNAKSFKFSHNDTQDAESKIIDLKFKYPTAEIYLITESVFSMDGDCPNLEELVTLSENYQVRLVIDEAHAIGVFGNKGEGFIQYLQVQDKIFARLVTFGKGLGCHGAAILGSIELKQYLINFARSFIYTTGLSPHAIATILTAYKFLAKEQLAIQKLKENIVFFNQEKQMLGIKPIFVKSKSAIQSAIIQGNTNVKNIALEMQNNGFDVKAILSPTVPEGQERLRFCLHSYNSKAEISEVLKLLSQLIFK
jgi:8-amino-7-oxononanoate synthase